MQGFNELGFKALRLFVAVLDQGSFSEVARREGIAPSSVSRQIQLMEQALHQQLLYRHTRAVTATDAGRLLAHHARRVLDQLEEAEQALQEQDSEPSGLVRINAPVVFGQRHLSPWLGQLCERYPKLELDLQQTDSYVDPLQAGADLLFRVGVMNDSSMQARILAPQHYRLAASPAYLARHGTPRHPDELAGHHCLVYKGDHGLQRWFFRQGTDNWTPYSVKGRLTGNHAETLTEAAELGMGLVMFPSWLIGEALHKGTLLQVMGDFQVATSLEQQQIAALWPGSRRLSLKVRTVIDFFVERFGPTPYWDQPPVATGQRS
ncbi:LysR family transcriptional regulator [Pseudomonas gingeri NCPPB 3146 = LMG 5327]|uniref:LysR family transcriptional regulator n=2 Tax=Pseudomonas gingeri TaxID=117681 RepID=A0A7Y7XX29_9PSED|nr:MULTISPECIES: LysR family transcriptional regulator [Pseudomonas]NWA11295.1 LysR family transcriptional regulator [Pseudomonas gingeri]NWC13625.1 LysR family transcriptional regulator [Pseudomonas gingeri]NWE69533.1 LysR family transcriptional regulator [Pseudomonas gingeri]PNQ90821.1 LysR family transcriptional regulator [Pseudomonas gingeri NCPPB 3146 = LMG 5327]BBP77009.1 LysR family transcriptional regulator [Pseudomonas sp. Ost2]